jgi:transposase
MSKQRYPEEFKIEAVKQITERGHRVSDVSARIGVSQHSLYKWIKTYAVPAPERQLQTSQTEERDILKIVHRGVAPSQWQETRVCLH